MKFRFVTKSLTALVILLILSVVSCSDSVTPEDKPGSRDYVWEVDTLEFERNKSFNRYCVIGDDLWLAGSEGGHDNIWQYKEGKWIHNTWMIGPRPIAIFGLNENSVWVFTLEGYIYRYTGGEWKEIEKINIPDYKEVVIQRVWGESLKDLYATGYGVYKEPQGDIVANGVVLHYDGTSWKNVSLPVIQSLLFTLYPSEQYKYLIWGSSLDKNKTWREQLYSFDGEEIKLLYEDLPGYSKLRNNRIIRNKSYYLYENSISEFSNGKFIESIDVSSISTTGIFEGRSLNDLFLTVEDGIVHYNGKDFEYMIDINSDLRIVDIALAETMVYVIIYNKVNQDYYIHKGKLK